MLMKVMKVAMLTYSLRPRGGVVHALSLAEAIMDRGVPVTLFSLRRNDDDPGMGFYRDTDVPTTVFEYKWHSETRARLESMVEAFLIGLPHDFEIYHAQDCVCDTALQRLAKRGDIAPATIRTVHHIENFPDEYLRKCELRALAGETAKITVSEYWKNRLQEQFDIDSTVIHNGIDLRRFEEIADRKREPFILFVGGMEARKGLEFAIQTMEILCSRNRDLGLVAVAKPGFQGVESRAWFEHLMERCGVADRVDLVENLDDERLIELYTTASAFFLPTRMEGWGLAIMEAMALHCPVISTPVGGVTELVTHGESALLVQPGNLKGFADAIEKLLDDHELKEMLCENAASRVKSFSWDKAAEKTLKFYNEVASMRKGN